MRAVLYILKHHTARRCLIFEFAHSFLLLPASQTVNYTAIVNVITGSYATPMRGNNPSAHGSMWCVLFSSQGAKRNFAFGSYARIKPAHIAICPSFRAASRVTSYPVRCSPRQSPSVLCSSRASSPHYEAKPLLFRLSYAVCALPRRESNHHVRFGMEPYAGIKPAHTPWRGVTLSLHQ